MTSLVIFHNADLDGICSAAIVRRKEPDCELYGIQYGEPFPWDKVAPVDGTKRRVYMVDFSLPIADMQRLCETAELWWADHHKTALDAAIAVKLTPARCCLSTQVAGCELTWQMVNHVVYVPRSVELLSLYDAWRRDDPSWDSAIMPFQYGMQAIKGIYDPTDPTWKLFFDWSPAQLETVAQRGEAVLEFQRQQNEQIARRAARTGYVELATGFDSLPLPSDAETRVFRWRAVFLNTQVYNSQAFEAVYDPEQHDVMVAYAQQADSQWKVSLYSTKPDVDCGAICKTFGGGGHKGAAGFVCTTLPKEWYTGHG